MSTEFAVVRCGQGNIPVAPAAEERRLGRGLVFVGLHSHRAQSVPGCAQRGQFASNWFLWAQASALFCPRLAGISPRPRRLQIFVVDHAVRRRVQRSRIPFASDGSGGAHLCVLVVLTPGRNEGLAVFIICFVIIGSFGMIALLTGVIGESMFEKNQLRAENSRKDSEQLITALEQERGAPPGSGPLRLRLCSLRSPDPSWCRRSRAAQAAHDRYAFQARGGLSGAHEQRKNHGQHRAPG